MKEQISTQSILETLSKVRRTEYNSDALSNVKFERTPYNPNTVRVKDNGFLYRELSPVQVFGALHQFGGRVDYIGIGKLVTSVRSLDFHGKSLEPDKKDKFYVSELNQFGNAKLLESPGTNVLILTKNPRQVHMRPGFPIKQKEMDDCRKWLIDNNKTILNESPISMHSGSRSSSISISSMAFVIE